MSFGWSHLMDASLMYYLSKFLKFVSVFNTKFVMPSFPLTDGFHKVGFATIP